MNKIVLALSIVGVVATSAIARAAQPTPQGQDFQCGFTQFLAGGHQSATQTLSLNTAEQGQQAVHIPGASFYAVCNNWSVDGAIVCEIAGDSATVAARLEMGANSLDLNYHMANEAYDLSCQRL